MNVNKIKKVCRVTQKKQLPRLREKRTMNQFNRTVIAQCSKIMEVFKSGNSVHLKFTSESCKDL